MWEMSLMILANLTRAIREQNYYAVVLEFLIVIAGVVIGFQITAWNEAREDREDERRVLQRLLDEAEDNVSYSHLIIFRAEGMQTDREAALARLDGQEVEQDHAERGLAFMSVYRDMTPIDSAYTELTGSGDIVLIQSQSLRDTLSLYHGVIRFHDRKRAEFIDRAPDILSLASDHITIEYDSELDLATYNSELDLGYAIEVDWQSASQDQRLINAINQVMGEQAAFHERRLIVRDFAQELCDELAANLQSECEPEDWLTPELERRAARDT